MAENNEEETREKKETERHTESGTIFTVNTDARKGKESHEDEEERGKIKESLRWPSIGPRGRRMDGCNGAPVPSLGPRDNGTMGQRDPDVFL